MNACPIPEDPYFARDVSLQMLEKFDDLGGLDAAGVDLKIKPPQRQSANDQEALPVKCFLQDRGLPAQRPCARSRGTGAHPAFIQENEGASFPAGLFFRAGHVVRFHLRMAFSSRSMARRSGRWQLNPFAFSIYQTCPG